MKHSTKILIIDDDSILRRLLQLNLSEAGYSVLEAASGEEGLRIARQEEPDVIILDVMMPGIDGWEVCQRLRELSDVPILILSARGLPRDKMKGLGLGADDYLSKPFQIDELLLRVGAILRRGKSPYPPDGARSSSGKVEGSEQTDASPARPPRTGLKTEQEPTP